MPKVGVSLGCVVGTPIPVHQTLDHSECQPHPQKSGFWSPYLERRLSAKSAYCSCRRPGIGSQLPGSGDLTHSCLGEHLHTYGVCKLTQVCMHMHVHTHTHTIALQHKVEGRNWGRKGTNEGKSPWYCGTIIIWDRTAIILMLPTSTEKHKKEKRNITDWGREKIVVIFQCYKLYGKPNRINKQTITI